MEKTEIEKYFCEDIEKSWDNCFKVWKTYGRIEDFSRHMRLPKYTPSLGKELGLNFAKIFKENYQFVIEKLYSEDNIEVLCAFECLEFICWEYNLHNVPENIYEIDLALPDIIMEEVDGDLDAPGFKGRKVGEFLKYKFEEEYGELI